MADFEGSLWGVVCLFVLLSQRGKLQLQEPKPCLCFVSIYYLRERVIRGGFAGGAFMSSLCIVSKLRCQLGWVRGCTVVGTAFLMCFSLRVFLRDAHTGVSRPRHEAPLLLMVEDVLRVLRG